MANLYHTSTNFSSSSSSEPDEISLFLQQILLRSSSSSSSSSSCFPSTFTRHQSFAGIQEPGSVLGSGRISVSESPLPPGLTNSSPGGCLPELGVPNMSSSSVGTFENDPNEYDCESEEALVEETTAAKPTPPRNSSKRSRAAEVHNLSEKRRRSRINEKMKALQNLIPNSNKTDKASMLDEAIEYLKQLQLQVQMLTMRNGLSLYPICLPGMLQPNLIPQLSTDISREHTKSSNANMAKEISADPGCSGDSLITLQGNCINQTPITDISRMIGSKTSFDIESTTPDNFGHLLYSTSSKGIGGEEELHQQQMVGDCSQPSFIVGKSYYPVAKATALMISDRQTSNQQVDNTLEACLDDGECLANVIINSSNFSSQFNNPQVGRTSGNHDAIKKERNGI